MCTILVELLFAASLTPPASRISKQTSLRAGLRAPRYFGLARLRHNEFVDGLRIRKLEIVW